MNKNYKYLIIIAIIVTITVFIFNNIIGNIYSFYIASSVEKGIINKEYIKYYNYIFQFIAQLVLYLIMFICFSLLKNTKEYNICSKKINDLKFNFIIILLVFGFLLYVFTIFVKILEFRVMTKYIFKVDIFDKNLNLELFPPSSTAIKNKMNIYWILFDLLIFNLLVVAFEEYFWRYRYFIVLGFNEVNLEKSILLNSIAFALCHLNSGLASTISAFMCSYFILTPLYIKYKNYKYNTIAHYIINNIIFLFNLLFSKYCLRIVKLNILVIFIFTITSLMFFLLFVISLFKKKTRIFFR